ncbi:MAG: SAM-dependent methyltransferase [Verrucomicrobiota bacterium]
MTAEGALRDEIVALIRKNPDRGISFSRFMELALYHPEHGYYCKPREIGRKGDFYTSVSVGECFGMLLARKIEEVRQLLELPEDFAVIEQGAHDGRLVADVLAHSPEGTRYRIVEPNPQLQAAQLERLGEKIDHWRDGDPPHDAGVYICNELVDAFPTHRIQYEAGEWRELRVVLENQVLTQAPFELSEKLRLFTPNLDVAVPDGFETEICPAAADWVVTLPRYFKRGVFIIIDYGLTSDEFFEPERREGTLRCFRDHQATDNPFEAIGETDITYQVDFSLLQSAAIETGLEVVYFDDQNHFLTEIAQDWLGELDGQPPSSAQAKLVRQFQTLTHPGLMGRAFKCLTLRI